jgi:hypothetical protein
MGWSMALESQECRVKGVVVVPAKEEAGSMSWTSGMVMATVSGIENVLAGG